MSKVLDDTVPLMFLAHRVNPVVVVEVAAPKMTVEFAAVTATVGAVSKGTGKVTAIEPLEALLNVTLARPDCRNFVALTGPVMVVRDDEILNFSPSTLNDIGPDLSNVIVGLYARPLAIGAVMVR